MVVNVWLPTFLISYIIIVIILFWGSAVEYINNGRITLQNTSTCIFLYVHHKASSIIMKHKHITYVFQERMKSFP